MRSFSIQSYRPPKPLAAASIPPALNRRNFSVVSVLDSLHTAGPESKQLKHDIYKFSRIGWKEVTNTKVDN